MEPEVKQLWKDIRNGVVDINNQDLFLGILAKAFLHNINEKLSIRNINIPHYILNAGDDIMYLEVKGQDHSIERPAKPGQTPEVSNENFVYSQIPRCIVQVGGVNIQADQLTSPYSYGMFEYEKEDMIYMFRSEFRRIPISVTYSLKYYFDNFSDCLSLAQQMITKLAFINTFNFTYLGNVIKASYKIPDDYNTEYQLEFDGASLENKARTINFDLEVSTNLPVIYPETVIPGDNFIRTFVLTNSLTEQQPGGLTPDGKIVTVDDVYARARISSMKVLPKDGIQKEEQGKKVSFDTSGHIIKDEENEI